MKLIIFSKKLKFWKPCDECNKKKLLVFNMDASDEGLNENYYFFSCLRCYIRAKRDAKKEIKKPTCPFCNIEMLGNYDDRIGEVYFECPKCGYED